MCATPTGCMYNLLRERERKREHKSRMSRAFKHYSKGQRALAQMALSSIVRIVEG